jgi:hypothetical protein
LRLVVAVSPSGNLGSSLHCGGEQETFNIAFGLTFIFLLISRQNWMAKYPLDTCSNGATYLDDSLTSLNWLQNLNIMKITSPTPPPSPVPFGNYH